MERAPNEGTLRAAPARVSTQSDFYGRADC
jgi:hypothetical protein